MTLADLIPTQRKPLVLVETRLAAIALGVRPEAVRKMRERGILTRHGTKTRALYDLEELTALAIRRDTRAQTSHAA
jgi:hypothetical protein